MPTLPSLIRNVGLVSDLLKIKLEAFSCHYYCSLGIVVTLEEIQTTVKALLDSKKTDLDEKRYQMLGILTGQLKNQLKWANFLDVKEALDAQLLVHLGPKDERDDLKNLASVLFSIPFLLC